MVLIAILIGDPEVSQHQRGVGGQCAKYLSGLAVLEMIKATAQRLAIHGDTRQIVALAIELRRMAAKWRFNLLRIQAQEGIADGGVSWGPLPVQATQIIEALTVSRDESLDLTVGGCT